MKHNSRKFFYLLTIIFCLIFFISPKIFAAAPVTHAVLAHKWIQLNENYNDEQKKSFMLGTLFPDIRYLGVIARNRTHERGVTLSRLRENQSEFTKGARLHAFVDKEREKCVVKWKIYKKLSHLPCLHNNSRYMAMFLKLLEDEILFDSDNWQELKAYLDTVHPEELAFGIQETDIRKWHSRQIQSFSNKPSSYLKWLSIFRMDYARVPSEVLGEWSQVLPTLAKDTYYQNYVRDLVQNFDALFKKP